MCAAILAVGQLQAQDTATDEAYKTLPIADQYKDVSSDSGSAADRANSNKKRGELMKRRREMQTAVSNFLKGKSSSANESSMQQWLSGYVIPSMAQNDNASLADLGKNRKNFFRNYLPKEATAQRRDQVIKLVAPAMQQIAEENYHPACRVNAVVLLSLLNSREGNRSSNQLPVPYAPMLGWLTAVVKGDPYPDYLKAPALAGLERQAAVRGAFTSQNKFSAQESTALGNEMLQVLKMNPETLKDVDPDLVYWMQRRALRTLGFIGDPGENGQYAKAIRDVISDDDRDMKTRIDAVAAYGMLDFRQQKDQAALNTVVPKIGGLLAQSAKDESKYIDDKINDIRVTSKFLDGKDATADDGTAEESKGPGLGGMADGGSPSGSKSKNNIPEVLPIYQRELVRRRIKHHANVTLIALKGNDRTNPAMPGLEDYADGGTQDAELIKALISDIQTLMAQADVKEPEPEEEEDDEEEDDRGDRSRQNNDEDEERNESLADELKGKLAKASAKLQATLDKFAPDQPAEDASGESAADEGSAAGQ